MNIYLRGENKLRNTAKYFHQFILNMAIGEEPFLLAFRLNQETAINFSFYSLSPSILCLLLH